MKQRFSSLDVQVIAGELSSSLQNLRLANVYDLSSRIFLFKFARPNHKQQLVVDSGFRCHLTSFARTTATTPSGFVLRLRKFLKTRRVTLVSQVGTDRIIDFQFSDGQYRLFLEFYASGNIVLTDRDLNVLALLRIITGSDQEELRVGVKYSLKNRQNYGAPPEVSMERIKHGLLKTMAKVGEEKAGKRSNRSAVEVRKALANVFTEYPSVLIDHVLLIQNLAIGTKTEAVLADEALLRRVTDAMHEAKSTIDSVTSTETVTGYIIAKVRPPKPTLSGSDVPKVEDHLLYDDFHPFRPRQFDGISEIRILHIQGFNKTVDEFFSSIESQKLESRLTEREENAKKKLSTARLDHQKRVGGLQQVQELNIRKAQAIEANLERVQESMNAVNGLIAQGMDWMEIARLIEMEQSRHNAVAEMIKLPLKLYENTVTVLLSEADFDQEEDFDGDETDSDVSESEDEREDERSANMGKGEKPPKSDIRLAIDVDLALSSWSNAGQYYDQKRTAAIKEQKTVQSSQVALKSTEKKINADLKKGLKQEKELLRPVRRQRWFEKFYYFISSEGYLVLGGKDAAQHEMLYRKYLSRGDVYVHADLHGAAPIIIKNHRQSPDDPIPPSTLSQAGSYCVATSQAWESKAVMAAWWVKAEQVSKLDSTGQYLSPGSFVIHGAKNFLPPAQLLLGFGVMFLISPASKAKHLRLRFPLESPLLDGASKASVLSTAEQEAHSEGDEHTDEEVMASDVDAAEDYESMKGVENELDRNPLQASLNEEGEPLESSGEKAPVDVPAGTSDVEADVGHDTQAVQEQAAPNVDGILSDGLLSQRDQLPLIDAKPKNTPPSQIRGKKGQRNKQKSKYAHQDEEDRALALRLLGSGAAQPKATIEAESKARDVEILAQKERRRQQHLATQQSGKESEDQRAQRFAAGVTDTLSAEESADLALVANYVGLPLPGDEILDALVVCAPWDAVGARLRWRIKMQPGTLKKGKAVKEILAAWTREIVEFEKKRPPVERIVEAHEEQEEGKDEQKRDALTATTVDENHTMRRQAELVKMLRDVEVIGTVPVARCRVVIGGRGGGGGSEKSKDAGKAKRGGRGSKKSR